MLLHKHLRIEKILSPYASPFYPITETNQITTETKTEKAWNTRNIKKAEIASKLHINIDDIKFKDEILPQEEEWTEVKHGVKIVSTHKDIEETPNNYYDELQEKENEEDEKEEEKKNGMKAED